VAEGREGLRVVIVININGHGYFDKHELPEIGHELIMNYLSTNHLV
jgi:predicted alternative tryptophan synthase beta-subunit